MIFFKKMRNHCKYYPTGYINRVIKVEKGGENGRNLYEIRHAAAENSVIGERKVFENADFIITAGG